MWVLSKRVTSAGPSLDSKDHSHEHSVIPAILERGYYCPQVNVGTLHVRVISVGPSLASKDHSHEQSVIPAILKRGYYHPQVNVGTLHARVTSACPSLASKDRSHEQSVIPTILKRGYYHPKVNFRPYQHLQVHFSSFMLERHYHPIIDVYLIITPHFLGGSTLSTCSPFV